MPPGDARQAAERRGRRAETLAALFLMLKGYRILDRRFRCREGEIDLVMRRGRTVAFVEVKARPDEATGLEAISVPARRRIVRAASFWLAARPEVADFSLRFDVVTVAPRRLPRHWPAAFDAAGLG